MNKQKILFSYFSKKELLLWASSVVSILFFFFTFSPSNYLFPINSIIGVTSLILNAKGNPIGQFLMIIFSILYGIISFSFSYYGEMITYLGMTMPMALFSLISWLKNPYKGNKSQVKINQLSFAEYILMAFLSCIVTVIFFYVLKYFNTSNIFLSTISVTTSFIACYLTFRRNTYYAIAYALNDVILIVLWVLASISNTSYIPVVTCFIAFLFNDIYGFISWRRMEKAQLCLE